MSGESRQDKVHQGSNVADQDDGALSSPIDGEPPRPSPVPHQGLRKRTSVLVGLGLLLFGLLVLFIAGDSAASAAPTQRAVQSFTSSNSLTTQGNPIEH